MKRGLITAGAKGIARPLARRLAAGGDSMWVVRVDALVPGALSGVMGCKAIATGSFTLNPVPKVSP